MKLSSDSAQEQTVAIWVLRLGVLAMPLSAGSYPFRPAAGALAWAVWALAVFVGFYRHPLGLVALRTVLPAGVILAIAASQWTAGTHLVVLAALAFTNTIGTAMVNGPAYPNEHRELLRAPGAVLIGPLELTWLAVVVPLVGASAALQTQRWILAVVLSVVGVVVGPFAVRSMHALARRWLVFVPAGLVVHDTLVLADPVLFQRELIELLQPAALHTDALDLTMGSWGLALELSLKEKVPMVLRKDLESGSSARLIVTPSRAGAVLDVARQRSIGATVAQGLQTKR